MDLEDTIKISAAVGAEILCVMSREYRIHKGIKNKKLDKFMLNAEHYLNYFGIVLGLNVFRKYMGSEDFLTGLIAIGTPFLSLGVLWDGIVPTSDCTMPPQYRRPQYDQILSNTGGIITGLLL